MIIKTTKTWLIDFGDRVYRYWVYRRGFTPYEQEEKFEGESMFEDRQCSFGIIREAINLGSDWLFGIQQVWPDIPASYKPKKQYLEYFKLSEIRLAYHENDQHNREDSTNQTEN